MEFACHGNLGSLIRRVNLLGVLVPGVRDAQGRLLTNLSDIGERDSKTVTQQLCAALLWLHNAGIIHRDIKPAVSKMTYQLLEYY